MRVGEEWIPFIFTLNLRCQEERGQRGKFGQQLEPDLQHVEIEKIESVRPEGGDSMSKEQFLDRYERSEKVLETVREDRDRLHDRAKSKVRDSLTQNIDIKGGKNEF